MERGDFRYKTGLFGTPWDDGKPTSDQEVVGSSPTGCASFLTYEMAACRLLYELRQRET